MIQLGKQGSEDVSLGGIGESPGRARPVHNTDRVAKRVAAHKDEPEVVEGVQPLAEGFFLLQRMRKAKQLNHV